MYGSKLIELMAQERIRDLREAAVASRAPLSDGIAPVNGRWHPNNGEIRRFLRLTAVKSTSVRQDPALAADAECQTCTS